MFRVFQLISSFIITFCVLGLISNISEVKVDLKITSSAFDEGTMIPKKYTCDDEDISPPLSWTEIPDGVESFALICDDPDAPMGTWVHWVIFNIPSNVHELPEGVPTNETLKNGSKQGTNDFGKIGYGGPCPPGGTHRYFFKLYALDTLLNLGTGLSKSQLLSAIKDHILSEGQLVGKYQR